MEYTRGYINPIRESRGLRPGRLFEPAHRIETASSFVHAVVPAGPAVSLCQRRVSRLGRDELAWDPEDRQACGLCSDEATRLEAGGPTSGE